MNSRNPRNRRNRPNRLGFETLEARAVLAAFMMPTDMPTEIAAPDNNEEVGMLVPAVQKVREAAARQTSIVDTNTDEDAAAHGAGGGGGAGKVSVHDISITKDDAPGDLTDGSNEAVDAIYDLIGQQDEESYLQYKLKDVLVSSWATSSS
jgi:hypothetical protein